MELFRTPNYIIRHAETLQELTYIEHMQVEVWGIHNPVELVPKDILLIVQKNGGLVLGAFDLTGKMIGFLFGFIGQTEQKHFKHCSHMMGVLQGYRHLGIGEQLKRVQRDVIRQQGLDLITWTVNPLEGVNASLNFGKLGVICRKFLPNFYGDMEDELNKGLPSDRFEVEWWIDSERVKNRLAGNRPALSLANILASGALLINKIQPNGSAVFVTVPPATQQLVVEMPPSIQSIKQRSMEIAKSWIDQTGVFFANAFAAGYIVTEFFSEEECSGRRNFYLLELAPKDITE